MSNQLVSQIPFGEVERMAAAIAASGLFGMKDKNQALALMIVAMSENRHPGKVATEYHVIQGRAALKADTMLARYQEAGGKVEWHVLTDELADATFTHPSSGSVRIDWSMERANRARLTGKDTWKQYPRAMLRSRVISEGVRTSLPGVLGGLYEVGEVRDMEPMRPTDAEMEAEDAKREADSRANAGPMQLMDAPPVEAAPVKAPSEIVRTPPAIVTSVLEREVTVKGKAKPVFDAVFEADGWTTRTASTFSTTLADKARAWGTESTSVILGIKPAKKAGYWTLESIEREEDVAASEEVKLFPDHSGPDLTWDA